MSFLKIIFFNLMIFILLFDSDDDVFKILACIAKNNAPIRSQDTACSKSEDASSNIFLTTLMGRAFCFFLFPSSFLCPLICSLIRKHILLSSSNLGSDLLFDLKACATYERVAATVPSTNFSLCLGEKVASLTAWKNAMLTFLQDMGNDGGQH